MSEREKKIWIRIRFRNENEIQKTRDYTRFAVGPKRNGKLSRNTTSIVTAIVLPVLPSKSFVSKMQPANGMWQMKICLENQCQKQKIWHRTKCMRRTSARLWNNHNHVEVGHVYCNMYSTWLSIHPLSVQLNYINSNITLFSTMSW